MPLLKNKDLTTITEPYCESQVNMNWLLAQLMYNFEKSGSAVMDCRGKTYYLAAKLPAKMTSPKTGMALTGRRSATVTAPHDIHSDCYATALFKLRSIAASGMGARGRAPPPDCPSPWTQP
jgi:hypothetical protein